MEIINRNIEEIIPYEKNPRNNDEAVDYVAKSIKEFGFKVPIVIDKNNVIITGHTRLKAAKMLGIKEIPTIIADDLSEEQIKAFRLVDNKVSEYSTWDDKLLNIELEDININMDEFGFNINLDIEFEEEKEIVEDEIPDKPLKTNIKKGDIFQLGKHRLMCGDSTNEDNINQLIDNNTIKCVFTSAYREQVFDYI